MPHRVEIGHQIVHRGVAFLFGLPQRPLDHACERIRNRTHTRERGRVDIQNRAEHIGRCGSHERHDAREHLVEDNAQAKDVAACVDQLAACLFG